MLRILFSVLCLLLFAPVSYGQQPLTPPQEIVPDPSAQAVTVDNDIITREEAIAIVKGIKEKDGNIGGGKYEYKYTAVFVSDIKSRRDVPFPAPNRPETGIYWRVACRRELKEEELANGGTYARYIARLPAYYWIDAKTGKMIGVVTAE